MSAYVNSLATLIGHVVLACIVLGALFCLADEGWRWVRRVRRRRQPVRLEPRLGLVACDCGATDCPALAGEPRGGAA